MNDKTKITFEFARAVVQQVITLSTSMILVTIAFYEKLIGVDRLLSKLIAIGTWVVLVFSISCGIAALTHLTTELQKQNDWTVNQPSIQNGKAVISAQIQIILFFIGLVLTIALAILAVLF